jgi:hypothetical protein
VISRHVADSETWNLVPERKSAVLLSGVPIEDRVVLQLAGLVEPPLGSKLVTAYRLPSSVLVPTSREREAILTALEDAPPRLRDICEAILDDWGRLPVPDPKKFPNAESNEISFARSGPIPVPRRRATATSSSAATGRGHAGSRWVAAGTCTRRGNAARSCCTSARVR